MSRFLGGEELRGKALHLASPNINIFPEEVHQHQDQQQQTLPSNFWREAVD